MIAHNTQSSGLASVSKMAGFRPCVPILVTVFLVLGMNSSTAKENCVISTSTLDGCPEGCDNCKSLMDYARNSTEYFHENNTRFRFLIGDHSLTNSTLIFMANISNLTLIGDRENSSISNASHRQAEIVCNGLYSGGFSFYNIFNLRIQSLSFIGCSHRSHNFDSFFIALEGLIIHNLHILNVNIHNTIGFGLLLDGLLGNSRIANTHISNSHTMTIAPHDRVCGNNLALYCSDYEYINDNGINNVSVTDSQFVNGSNHCKHRASSTAGGIYIQVRCNLTLSIAFNRISVEQNYGYKGGNIGITYVGLSEKLLVTISINESVIAFGNAYYGGGLYMTAVLAAEGNSHCYDHANTTISTPILSVSNTIFQDNKAPIVGAAVYFRLRETIWSLHKVADISFRNCHFTRNKITYDSPYKPDLMLGGVAVHIKTHLVPQYENHFTPLFNIGFENCNFAQNSMAGRAIGGVFYALDTQSINLINSRIVNNFCPGIIAIHSNLLLSGSNLIHNNNGTRGGGLVFCSGSYMRLYNNTLLTITENNATQYGGGIYVEDDCTLAIPSCFFQVDSHDASSQTAKVILHNNSAGYAGTALYGGLIDRCTLLDFVPWHKGKDSPKKMIFNAIFDISHNSNTTSSISSDPVMVCFCSGSTSTNCSIFTKRVSTVPGFSFQVSAIILGQRSGPVRGVVNTMCQENCKISQEQQDQNVQATDFRCSNLNYTIFASENTVKTLQLIIEDSYYGNVRNTIESIIEVHVQKCPFGFVPESKHHSCKCIIDSRPNIQCSIHNKSITRQPPVWIGYKYDHKTETNYIIFHPYCPLGYCIENSTEIKSQENTIDQDAQCAQNRKDLLCGACKTNYSLGFGTLVCLRCKHKPLPALRVVGLIAVCGVAGILLVVLLTLLNLTVSEGTLNGLIFYANIVQVNSDIFFPPESHARPLTAFIAWLNLDFGITTCFYDGMDAYAKTWLQFLFPLYIWLISGAIVYFSWKSNRVARLAGRNAVKVLATLFLLSFGKLLRTIIAAVTFTNIASPNKTIDISVWLPDSSVHYLHGKHTPLFVLAVIAAVLSLFYTLTLTFIQCLRRTPNNRMFVWVRKLKPLLDAYTGPYKDRYHFWTGLLLLARVFLFICFAFNLTQGPILNLGLIVYVCTLLMIAIQPGIYRHLFLGLLESSMYVNLILFSTVTIFLIDSYTEYKILTAYFFGGWALVTFLGIVAYHAYRRAPDCGQLRVWCREKLRPRGFTAIQPVIIPRDDSEELESEESDEEREMTATWNTPHLRESLIGNIQ